MEAGNFQDLQGESASWRHLTANDEVLVEGQRHETQDSQWCSSSPKAGNLETQEELTFHFEHEGKTKASVPA
jgi:hypothetical protein